MSKWEIVYSKKALKDSLKLKSVGLKEKTALLLEVIRDDPFAVPPSYEKSRGDLKNTYSRRINLQHRLVYEVFEDEHIVKVIRMWTHYE